MEFLKQNKTIVALALAIILAVAGAVFKVDVPALLNSVGTINKEVGALVDEPAAPTPAPAAPAKPVE